MKLSTYLAQTKPASLAAIKTVSHDIAVAARRRTMIHLVQNTRRG